MTALLHRQLRASLDLTDLGAALRDAGTAMTAAGTTVMQLNELPGEHAVQQLNDLGWQLVRCATALRTARVTLR